MPARTTVFISKGQSNHPAKRQLEAELALHLMRQPTVDVVVVPHLYDLRPEHPAVMTMRHATGSFVVLAWLYPRAAHWILDRLGVAGRMGASQTRAVSSGTERDGPSPVTARRPLPRRTIFHVDLRSSLQRDDLIAEIESRITACGGPLVALDAAPAEPVIPRGPAAPAPPINHPTTRRWYPVIDYSRCTNCMECIDFCLFGVYGIDAQETILVEQPDNCRKGCPACSRVCPENAIMFPQHKSPAIAGDPTAVAGAAKLNLSDLFGAPAPADTAQRERDQHLRDVGRERGGGDADGAPAGPQQDQTPRKDALDGLVDQLNELDL